MAQEGYWGVTPRIKSVAFPARGKFQVNLEDGRVIIMPVSAFPSLKKVPVKERNSWYLMGGAACHGILVRKSFILNRFWVIIRITRTRNSRNILNTSYDSAGTASPPAGSFRCESKRGEGERAGANCFLRLLLSSL